MGAQPPEREGTVSKALAVLEVMAAAGRPVKFTELQGLCDYPKPTLYRLVQTLTAQGMLAHDPETGSYSMGLRLVRMAHSAWSQASIAPIARPHLDALSQAAGETVHLAQLDGSMVLYVDKRNAAQPVPMFSAAGKVGPAFCTGVGKAMLAFLPEPERQQVIAQQSFHRFTDHTLTTDVILRDELALIRDRGHAYDREEHEPGIICIAMPILSDAGRVLGAVSVTSTTARTILPRLDAHLPALRSATQAIARDLAHWAFPNQHDEGA